MRDTWPPARRMRAAHPRDGAHAFLLSRVRPVLRGGLSRLLAPAMAPRPGLAVARRELLLLRVLEQVAGVPDHGHVGHGLPARPGDGCGPVAATAANAAGRQPGHEPRP